MLEKTKRLLNKPIVKTGAKYTYSGVIKSLATMLSGFAVMIWVAPMELGKWNAVSMLLAYAPFLQLGIQSGLAIELPILMGSNDNETLIKKISNGYGYAFLVSAVLLVIGSILSIISVYTKDIDYTLGLITITLMAISTSLRVHLTARYRSAKAFDVLSRIQFIDAIITLLSIFFIYKMGFYGILLSNALTYIISTILRFIYRPFKDIKPTLNFSELYKMGKLGIALMCLIELRSVQQTIPKWIIIARSSVKTLGLYSPAIAINTLFGLIPREIGQFYYPQMGYLYGKSGKAADIWPYAKKLLLFIPLCTVPLAILVWIFSPWLLETFFPKYIESLWAMRVMAIAFVFTSANALTWIFNTLKAFNYSYLLAVLEFAGAFIFPYAMTLVISNVLVAVTVGLAINSLLCYCYAWIFIPKVLFQEKYNQSKC